MPSALRIVDAGLMTTVQDLGRPGYQHLGIPVSGALDPVGLRAANLIAGNPPNTGALEIAYLGPTFAVEAESVRLAFAGAAAPIDLSAGGTTRRLALLQSFCARKGETVRVGALGGGAVLYLAVEGGFDIAPVLGSRSTLTRAALGGFQGRALRPGDRIPLAWPQAPQRDELLLPALDLTPPKRFRVVLGPQDDYFTANGIRTLLASAYTVAHACDRMGMRLEGPALEHAKGYNIVSDGIAPGSIQVPGDGRPIVLLADRQTTGGYPKVATVISADLPALGRLTPGAKVAFAAVDIEAAEAAHRHLMAALASLPRRIVAARPIAAIDETRLMEANLVGGVVDACNDAFP
ncbi:MAG: biotin-dependent carboxyltransferase family protein [Hyphomicrobiaceae bacterium]